MHAVDAQPPFGSADLTNCERELIHLAGSIQPHGALLVIREHDRVIVQASVNAEATLDWHDGPLLGKRLDVLGADLAAQVQSVMGRDLLSMPAPLHCMVGADASARRFDAMVHRPRAGRLVVELEPFDSKARPFAGLHEGHLPRQLASIVSDFAGALNVESLSQSIVTHTRALTGFDRVMVYRFDEDGHGEVVAEARDERFEPFLGLHYPASDIPQRARELYVRNKVRVLTDVDYTPVPIIPRAEPGEADELDMSMCFLRSMSPLHLQYLRNMGVTATLVVSLLKEGQLWGLIACHHYARKAVGYETRAACELLAEVISTRLSALETYSQARAELLARQLERRLIDATAATGDWRLAAFSQANLLQKLLDASGVALYCDAEITAVGETPDADGVREIAAWLLPLIEEEGAFQTAALSRANPALAHHSALASGILAVSLSASERECLIWFRKEQVRSVTWAGNPNKPFVVGNDPMDLSPRRSFAAWSEQVRETARPWSGPDMALAGAVRASLVDLALQVRSVRVLIAETQSARARVAVEDAEGPIVIADGRGQVLLMNRAFHRLLGRPVADVATVEELAALFGDPTRALEVLTRVRMLGVPWRGELDLLAASERVVPVAVRIDAVPTASGETLGIVLMLTDYSDRREAEAMRQRFLATPQRGVDAMPLGAAAASMEVEFETLVTAIFSNASSAVMEISDSASDLAITGVLRDVERSARRAKALSEQLVSYSTKPGDAK